MNKALLYPEVKKFIQEHLNGDLTTLILKGSPFPEVSIQEIATQITGIKKAKNKLPTWFGNRDILYPQNLNLEQTSSEVTAKYKSGLIGGDTLIDLTGGFGIDDYHFSKSFKTVLHCELNEDLSELAAHNFSVLGVSNIKTIVGDSLVYLRKTEKKHDWIYLDPARRDDYGGKVFLLEQCTPNVPANLKLLFQKSYNILIKSSPLLDLTAGIAELRKVMEIHIVSVNNEVKELLWILNRNISKEIKVKTINITKKETQYFEAVLNDETEPSKYSLALKFLYEPNPAIMKSKLFGALSAETHTYKLQSNSHLFTSEELQPFPGRSFEIMEILPYHKKALRRSLKLNKANITTRNFPKSVSEIRKELKIEDGGNNYLFFTTDLKNDKIVLVCRKVSNIKEE
ncbi:RNA cap guanine-N2 methyltransferase [Gillisia sp. Hel_I_86]|uniref:class I SAM-dependent methyltransferase n=1 Tax=Gillisia sp. Hel_I_86 TaxID=1249981 RepID=UPI0011995D25|nr:class I SAM-dependent methyltransferase [Gillisia sp. Hel_I_86]TVZ28234.1 RNA cap guanine-N2 methyltransferase [Gillisia sp. Hel_I_86]